jgi:hypothetical protein
LERGRTAGGLAPGWVVLAAALSLVSSSGAAMAAEPARTPSGEALRQTYPLETKPESGGGRPTASLPAASPPAAGRSASERVPPRTSEQGTGYTIAMVLLLVAAAGVAAAAVLRHRHDRDERAAPASPATAAPSEPAPAPPDDGTARARSSEDVAREPPPSAQEGSPPLDHDSDDGNGSGAPRRPAREREWIAEIGWRSAYGFSRFVVVASSEDKHETVILTSRLINWPPKGAEGVADLERAVSDLEAVLLGDGWTPLERGDAWYARRFSRTAPSVQQAQPAPSGATSGRFRRRPRRRAPIP